MIAEPLAPGSMLARSQEPCSSQRDWDDCRFLTCSVLPVRVACNLRCPFCFSRSSISALRHEPADWRGLDVSGYYRFACARGATRLVITGGGEPLLRADDVVYLIGTGRRYFEEIALFTNGTYLCADVSRRLANAGLSYFCYSRHAADDATNRQLMGEGAPALADFLASARPLKVRATCVMARGFVDDEAKVWEYIQTLREWGVREFTFKHTYVAYGESLFRGASEAIWAREHRIDFDPFAGQGEVIARLPWGPCVRLIQGVQVCYYHEPTPQWELENRLCRSSNLLSDGSVYASLEDTRSLLYRLKRC